MTLRTPLFAIVMAAVTLPAMASQIFHRTLEEVLEEADWIVVATVVTAQRTNSQHSMDATYKLQVVETLQGTAPAVPVHYTQPIPILYDDEGHEIGTFSPILDGSGSELGLKEGETWIFVGNGPASDDAQIAGLCRVEPRENLGAITTWLTVKASEKTDLPVPEKDRTERSLRGAIGGAWR